MIPDDIENWIFPEIADGTEDAVILNHCCGITFQFKVEYPDGETFVLTSRHLKSWGASLDEIVDVASDNCFLSNTIEADPEGVYFDTEGNAFSMLLGPGTFLEHNHVDGAPILLVINEFQCVLTGSESLAGAELIQKHREHAIATSLVTIDDDWEHWVTYPETA